MLNNKRKRIRAACAIIPRGEELLVGKRAFGSMAGKWELIGGKIEGSETPAEAVVRELKEELSVTAIAIAESEPYEHRYEEFDLDLFPIICELEGDNADVRSKDHSEVKWVHLDEILSLDFVEADFRAIKKYISDRGHFRQRLRRHKIATINVPSYSEVIERLKQLIQESVSREEIATWAQKWVIADNPPDMDERLWRALKFIAGADLISTDRPYLYSTQDFEQELAKLLKS